MITPNDTNRSTADWRSDFKKAQSRVNSFWNSWSKDYLSLLHNRSKWRVTREELKQDELVLVVDKLSPRSTWKMARVVRADAEVDEHVRKALVRLANGKTVLRDRSSLVRMELDTEEKDIQFRA